MIKRESKPFTAYIRENFIENIMQLSGNMAECFLNDGSSFVGNFQHYNSKTGEYYFIGKDDKIYIVSHFNCLKIVFER